MIAGCTLGQCGNVNHVVWMLQSGVILFLRGTLNMPPYGRREYYLAQSNGMSDGEVGLSSF
jgi:hypothetical protein